MLPFTFPFTFLLATLLGAPLTGPTLRPGPNQKVILPYEKICRV